MKKSRIKLECFEPEPNAAAAPAPLDIDHDAFEEERLAAFEKGYSAGWDDAVAAQEAEGARLRADIGQNLQELSFTYHEARQNVLMALKPLLSEMAAKLLPALARQSLAQMVAEQLFPLAESLSSVPITVVANPHSLPQIEEVMAQRSGLPLVFAAEPSLSEGQAYLKFAETETRIDLDEVIHLISAAIESYFTANQQEPVHG